MKVTNKIILTIFMIVSLSLNGVLLYKKYNTQKTNSESSMKPFVKNRQSIYTTLTITRLDTVFIGDSQTQYFELSEFFKTKHVKNRGIRGDTTQGVLDRLSSITAYHPKVIFLNIGINDFMNEHKSADQAFNNYKLIFETIKRDSPETKIVTSSIFPCSVVDAEKIKSYNKKIKSLTSDHIDLFSEFENGGKLRAEYDSGDGVHLSGAGYVKWVSLINEL